MNIESLIDSYGYYAVLLGSLLEGETVLILAGYAAHRGYLALPWVVTLGAIGGFVGDQIYFAIGRRTGPLLLDRFPAAAHVMPRFERLATRFPTLIVVMLRFAYGLRTVGPMALGASQMPLAKFAPLNAIGAIVWALIIGGAGYVLGHTLEIILADARKIEEVVFAVILVAGAAVWLIRRRRSVPQ